MSTPNHFLRKKKTKKNKKKKKKKKKTITKQQQQKKILSQYDIDTILYPLHHNGETWE